jgi:hypothetical protein
MFRKRVKLGKKKFFLTHNLCAKKISFGFYLKFKSPKP